MVLFGKREGGKFRERVREVVCVWVSPELFFKFKCSTLFTESGNSVHVTRVSSIVLGPIISMKLKLAFCTAGIRDLCHGYNAKDVEKKSASWVRETAGLQLLDKPRITDRSVQCKF